MNTKLYPATGALLTELDYWADQNGAPLFREARKEIERLDAECLTRFKLLNELKAKLHAAEILMDTYKAAESRLHAKDTEYREWFDQNGAVLATHRIGGFGFIPAEDRQCKHPPLSDAGQKLICENCKPAFFEEEKCQHKYPEEEGSYFFEHCVLCGESKPEEDFDA